LDSSELDAEKWRAAVATPGRASCSDTNRNLLLSHNLGGVLPRDVTPLNEWQELYARRGTQLGFLPSGDAPFFSSVQPILDAPRMVRARLSPGVLFRDKTMMRDRDDRLSLTIAETPGYHVSHRGRELRLDRGDATLFQADAPGRSGSPSGFTIVEISMPQTEWQARGVRAGDLIMRPIGHAADGLKLLSGYVRSLEGLGSVAAHDTHETIRRHVIDLVVLAATRSRPVGESEASAVVAARRAAVIRFIDAHFRDPELSVTSVANALRISPRYVQRLLRSLGTPFTAYVTELRLQHAFRLLQEAGQKTQRITDVAMEAGFSEVSYFNRLFRSRFGDTPGGVRMMQVLKDEPICVGGHEAFAAPDLARGRQ
jgi:AraC-like DNA-binding protein